MTGGREPLSRPSSRHGEARHPLTLKRICSPWRERPARLPKQEIAPWKQAAISHLLVQAESRDLSAFLACA